ncbi:MAG: YqaJ viral recombinase family protein [Polyangiaceae bacterium]|nr:YqaJ viral recombinase family protein [Polyangiaceae bacterium]
MTLSPEQLEQRRHILTASDAAAVLGLNPWRSAYDVWAEKTGETSAFAGNWHTRRGHAIEPLLLAWLGEQKSPLSVRPAGDVTCVHPILSWLGATPDGLVFETGNASPVAVAEAKSSGHRDAWVDDDDEPMVAEIYMPQVVVQMAVKQLPRAYVVVEILTEGEPWIIEVERDWELEAIVLEELDQFWRHHVMTRVAPELGDDATYQQVATVFRRQKRAELVPATSDAQEQASRYIAAKAAAKAAESEAEAAKVALCKLIGDAEGVHGNTWRATWKWREPQTISYERAGYRHFDLREVGAAAKQKTKKGAMAA